MPPVATLALQQISGVSIVNGAGILTPPALQYFTDDNAILIKLQQQVNQNLGVNTLTLTQAQALTPGASDAGLVVFISTFAHLVYWDGAAWQWMDGDLPGHIDDWVAAPSTGWALCDGSATTFLTIGATLGTSAFTTPNLSGTPSYKKSAAAYTGTLVGALAPGATMAGSTATGTTGTGTTGTGTTGTGTTGTGTTGTESTPDFNILSAGSTLVAGGPHTHSIPGLSVPGLSVPGLSVPGLSIPALGVGTIATTVDATGDPAHLATLPYVRR